MGDKIMFGFVDIGKLSKNVSNLGSSLTLAWVAIMGIFVWHESKVGALQDEIDILKEQLKKEEKKEE